MVRNRSEMGRTFFFIKPGAVKRQLVGEVISRIEKKGLKIVALKMVELTQKEAEELYSVHKGKKFFKELVNYVTSGPIVAAIVEGRDAVNVVRRMIGATDPVKAQPGTIRGDLGLDLTDNVIHASDSKENYLREKKIIFPEVGES